MTKTPKGRATFDRGTTRALQEVRRKRITLLTTVSVIILLLGGYFAYHTRETRKEKELVAQYSAIEQEYQQQTRNFFEQMQKLPQNLAFSITPNYDVVADKFAAFAKKYPKHPYGQLAAIKAASVYSEKTKTKEALELLEPLAKANLSNTPFQLKVRQSLAGLYAQDKNYEKAIKELEYCEKLKDNPIVDEIRLTRAQYLYLAGKTKEAGELLADLSKSTAGGSQNPFGGDSSVGQKAREWKNYWGL